MNLLDDQDAYEQITADLLGRNDLLSRLSMIDHVRKTIDYLEREMHRQWRMAEDVFRQMERDGLEGELGMSYNTPTHLRPPSPDSDEPLPPYRRTASPNPSVRHRRPTPAVAIVFPDISLRPLTPSQPQPTLQPTQSHAEPIGTREHPILVEEDDDDTLFCTVCRTWGHEWLDCHEYQCEHCQVYGPGHTLSDCFYC